jgi:cytochrome c
MRIKPSIGVLALSLVSCALTPGVARADETLAKRHNCVMCHEIEQKYIGPAFQDVAQKYTGQPEAAAMLYEKVKKGGGGVWGKAAMPPNSTVPAGDIRKLVDWVLRSNAR